MPNALEWLAGSSFQDMTRKKRQQFAVDVDVYESNAAGRATAGSVGEVKEVKIPEPSAGPPRPNAERFIAAHRPAAVSLDGAKEVEKPEPSEKPIWPSPGRSDIIINLNISGVGGGSAKPDLVTMSAELCKCEKRHGKDVSLPQLRSAMKGGKAAQNLRQDEGVVYHCRGCGKRKVTVKWDLPDQTEEASRSHEKVNVRQDLTSYQGRDPANSRTVSAQNPKRDGKERESGDNLLIQPRRLPLHNSTLSPRQILQQQRLAHFQALPPFVRANMPRLLQDPRAEVVVREDVFEDPGVDPQPNAHYDAATGRLVVYHGPHWGSSGRLSRILPARWPLEYNPLDASAGGGLPGVGQPGLNTTSGIDMGMNYPSWMNAPPATPGVAVPYGWAPPTGYAAPPVNYNTDIRSGQNHHSGQVNGHGENRRNTSNGSANSTWGNHASIITNNPWNMPTTNQNAVDPAWAARGDNNNSTLANPLTRLNQNGHDPAISPLTLDSEDKAGEQSSSWLGNGATNGNHPSINDDGRDRIHGSPSSVDSWMIPGAMGPTHVSPRRGRTLDRTPAWGDASAANSTTAWGNEDTSAAWGNADGANGTTGWNSEEGAEDRSSGWEPAWGDANGANSTSEWGNGEGSSSGW